MFGLFDNERTKKVKEYVLWAAHEWEYDIAVYYISLYGPNNKQITVFTTTITFGTHKNFDAFGEEKFGSSFSNKVKKIVRDREKNREKGSVDNFVGYKNG